MTVDEWMKQKNIADYGPHLDPIIRLAFEAGAESRWLCFHCGFSTSDHKEAKCHFGDRDDESPVCVFWRDLDADGKLSEHHELLGELAAERDENIQYRSTIEGLEYRLLGFENLLCSRFLNCKTLNDAFNLYDSMEGRALAAEEKLRELTQGRAA